MITNTISYKENKITEFLFFILLFTPFFSYLTFGVYGKENFVYYFQLFMVLYAIVFLFYSKFIKIILPKYVYFLFFYILYIFFWSFFNGTFEKKGLFFSDLREQVAIFLILLLINNIKISDKFIKTAIPIIKLTIIISFIVSVFQFFNPAFLDATPLYRFKYFEKPSIELSNPYEFRRLSVFGYTDMNDLGFSFLSLLVILISYLTIQKKKSAFIYYGMGIIVAALSNTRYVIIGALFLILAKWKIENLTTKDYLKNLAVFTILIVLAGISLQIIGYDLIDWFSVRLFAEQSVSKTTRFGALENFLIFYPKTPFIGTGVHMTAEIALASKFVGSSQIHVGYLSHLVTYGLFGSFFLFGFWFYLAKDLYQTAKKTNFWGSFFAFLIFLWANFTLVMYSIFFYGLIISLIFDKYYKDYYKNSNS